jgi:ABC-type nickel/cobalt efflux system permease component RcnA
MGNFSISHYAGITLERGFLEIRYLLDMAEIPTFQELQQTGLSAHTDDPKLGAYLAAKGAELARGLQVSFNGNAIALQLVSQNAIFPPGAGNLPTMKVGFVYRAAIPRNCAASACTLEYNDTNFATRAGWKEIVLLPSSGMTLVSSTASATDRSAQLSNYPTDLLNSPPQDLHATIVFSADAAQSAAPQAAPAHPLAAQGQGTAATEPRAALAQPPSCAGPQSSSPQQATEPGSSAQSAPLDVKANQQSTPRNAFTELMSTKEISFSVAWFAALIAIGLGALHALEPGHGKTIVAAYLVGAKGTARHAVLLGSIVTLSHTAGVYFLGAVTLYAQKYIVPDQLYPFLGVVSGLIIAGMGLYLFLQRYAGKLVQGHTHGGHTHSHGPFGHTHSHGPLEHSHSHDHLPEHSHEHLTDPVHPHVPEAALDHVHPHTHEEKPSATQLLVLGITGGIVPCPAALVVLLSAVALHRVGFGLFLIVAFSVGLAAVLIAMGLAAVYARRLMSRVPTDGVLIRRWLPLTSAAMITILGCAIAVRGLIAAGIVQIHL